MTDSTSLAEERAAFATAAVATVFAWYALPDVVRSRGVRVVAKAGLSWVTAWGVALVPAVYPESADLADRALRRMPTSAPAAVAVAVGAVVAGVAAMVWFEKAAFARGEARLARGVRFPHTRQAAALALATATVAVADWPALATVTRRD